MEDVLSVRLSPGLWKCSARVRIRGTCLPYWDVVKGSDRRGVVNKSNSQLLH